MADKNVIIPADLGSEFVTEAGDPNKYHLQLGPNLRRLPDGRLVGSIIEHFGSRYLFDPNEVNGWTNRGIADDSNNTRVKTLTGAATYESGGYMYPFDVRVEALRIDYLLSNNQDYPHGFFLQHQEKTDDSAAITNFEILDQVADNGGVGPYNPRNPNVHKVNLDLSAVANNVVPAGNVITFGVACSGTRTQDAYLEVMSGHIEIWPV